MSAPIDPAHNAGPRSDEPPGAKPKLVESIVIASELWIVVLLAHVVTTAATYDQTRHQLVDLAKTSYGEGTAEYTLVTSSALLIAMLVITVVVEIGVAIALIVLTRKGYNWARFLLGALSLYLVIGTFFSLFGDVHPRWAMIPNVIGGVAALGAVVLLLRRESDGYCKKMAQWRRTRNTPPPTPYPPIPGQGAPPYYPPQPGPHQGYPPQYFPPTPHVAAPDRPADPTAPESDATDQSTSEGDQSRDQT